METEHHKRCRSCGAPDLTLVLSLGRMPLANSLLTTEQLDLPEETFALDLAFCVQCSLVQITETVPPEKLFREYVYFSSYSDTMLGHARELVDQMLASENLSPDSLVVEIASNDGYLLQYYKHRGVPVLGIEPARNVARVASEQRGIRTVTEFFGLDLARQLAAQGQRADVVHVHNVLAHVAELNGFVAGLRLMLKEDGVAVIEVPYLKDLLDKCEFDTIYHEHLCYFSLTALDRLVGRHDLEIADVQRVSIHGGSLRLFLCARGQRIPTSRVSELLAAEGIWGVGTVDTYNTLARRAEWIRDALPQFLLDRKQEGGRLAAYGAAAKGATLLNYTGIGRHLLEFVVDRSPHKQGRYMPGVRLPIHAPGKLLESKPDYVLLLTWNLADEILEQQSEYRRHGGRFVIPIPEPRIV